jgi:tetratricopeptide (TPR) repeat protein
LDEAQASADGALAIFAARKTQAGTDAADALLAAAWIDRLRGANEKARSNFDQAIAADRASPEPDKLALASHLLAEADFLSAVNAAPAAQPLIREALDIRQRQLPDGFWSTDLTRLVQAETADDAGDVEPILAKLRARLGDNALLTQAAVERAARIGQSPGGPAFRAPLF